MEKYILKELGFGFYNIMDHPHKFILYYIKTLGGDSALAQKAWNYLNDSLRLDCCVRYRAELIACAAIFMAARDLQVRLSVFLSVWLAVPGLVCVCVASEDLSMGFISRLCLQHSSISHTHTDQTAGQPPMVGPLWRVVEGRQTCLQRHLVPLPPRALDLARAFTPTGAGVRGRLGAI